mgnify:CR=1 FL=1
MKLRIKEILLAVLLFLLVFPFFSIANAEDWKNVVQFQMGVYQYRGEDYSRTSPPYKQHVTLSFDFKNLTSNKQIKGIAFRAKFLDSFNDVLYTTETLKLSTSINPGDFSGPVNMWYYENDPYSDSDPFDKLVSAIQAGNLKARVDFVKIALHNGSVLEYPEVEWQKGLKERKTAGEWAEAFASWKGPGKVKTSVFGVSTERWKVDYVAFDVSDGNILQIGVYEKGGKVVKKSAFKLTGTVPTGKIVLESGPGKYFLKIGGNGAKSDWTVYVREPQK